MTILYVTTKQTAIDDHLLPEKVPEVCDIHKIVEELQAELAALKKDARHIANWAKHRSMNDSLRDACDRILAATKEEP